jgi:hypothetical protein
MAMQLCMLAGTYSLRSNVLWRFFSGKTMGRW